MSTKRTDVLNATLALINKQGFAATSTDDIAKLANVGKGTIYKYFPSKQDLYNALFDELRSKFIQLVAANYDFKIDPKSNFKSTVFVLVRYYSENVDEFRYLERYSDVNLQIDKRLNESTKLIEPIKKMLQEINHQIKFRKLPPMVIFAMTYGPLVALVNLVHLGKIELNDDLIDEIAEACWEAILEK